MSLRQRWQGELGAASGHEEGIGMQALGWKELGEVWRHVQSWDERSDGRNKSRRI
jgi:hypothetical protein